MLYSFKIGRIQLLLFLMLCCQLSALNIVNSSEFMVNVKTTHDQQYSTIASLGDSKFVISYTSEHDPFTDYFAWYARIFHLNGTNLTTEFLVSYCLKGSINSNDPPVPSIASLNDGESFAISWVKSDSNIYLKIFDSLGRNLTDEIIVENSVYLYKTYICSIEDEKYLVITWTSSAGNPFAKIFYSNGSEFGPKFQVSTLYSSYNDIISLDQGSSFLIVWGNGDIFGKKFYSNGTNMTSELQINFNTSGNQNRPSVSEVENGYVVTWEDFNSKDGDGSGVFARSFALNDTAITNDFQVNEHYVSYQGHPKAASIDNGKKFIITWSRVSVSNTLEIYAKVYDLNSNNLTREFLVNDYADQHRFNQAITGFKKKKIFAISWDSLHQDGSGYGIFAKTFSVQLCSNESDYYYPHNGTCLPYCNSKTFAPNITAGILSCNFICNDGLYYLDYLSNCTSCNMKGYKKVEVNGLFYCDLICNNTSKYYHSYNNSCLDSCPIELNLYGQMTEYNAHVCEAICNNNTFLLLLNQSCISTCNASGFHPQIFDGIKICSFNCSKGDYLITLNNTCQSSCNSPSFVARNESNYLFCDFKCSNSSYFYSTATNSCYQACPISYYKNYTHQICSPCQLDCLDCQNSSYCYTCKPLYQSKNGTCIIANDKNETNTTNMTNMTNRSPVFIPSVGKENIIGSLTLPSIQLLALSTDEKTVFITSNNGENLLAIDVQDHQNPTVINSIKLTNCQALKIFNNVIYLADSTLGVKIIDATDPGHLITLSTIPLTNIKDIVIDKTRKIAMLSDIYGIIYLYSIENLASPSFISQVPITMKNTTVYKMTLSNDEKRVYVSSSTGFYVVDVSISTQPAFLVSVENVFMNSHASNSLDSNFVYLTEASGGIKVLDLTNLGSPKIVESIASSQIQSISCYSTNCYVSSGSNLIVFESSGKSFSNKGAIPTYSLANAFAITSDMKYGFLIDGTTSLRIIDFQSSPSYFLFMKQRELEIGRKYTESLLIYNLMIDGTYSLFSGSYKFSKLSFYAVNFNPDSSLTRTFTNLPYWIDFDSSTNIISSNPDSAALIGRYNLYGAFSLPIPEDLFVGIGSITNIEKSLDLIIHLSRYIDDNLYLTSNFDPNKALLLNLSEKPYEKEIRKKLAQYYFPMLTVLQVDSSLKLNQNNDIRPYLNITTASLYSISILLTFDTNKIRFMNSVTQSLAKLNDEGNSILLTAALSDLNQALYNLRVDLGDSTELINGKVVINDGLNPPLATNVTNMKRFFLENRSPVVNIPIQKQINSISIVTGSQMNILLEANTFLDPDKDSLTYRLISTNNEDNLPSWIEFKNMFLSGLPPDQLYFELTLIIRASDGYKSIDDKFTLKIEPSLFYLFQLGASFAGPIIGLLGLWIYASKIYNVLFKKVYRYPKSFEIKAKKELCMHKIYPIALLSEYLAEAEILISMMTDQIKHELNLKKVSKLFLVEYFLSENHLTSQIDEEKIIKKIEKIMAENSSKLSVLNLKNYDYNLKYSRNRIHSLVIFKFYMWHLRTPSQLQTKIIFENLKKNWISHINIDRMEPIGSNGLPNFFLRTSFTNNPNINSNLLEKALISYAQLRHNIKSKMTQIKISAKEKSDSQNILGRINNFFNGDSISASNDMEESIRHGITYQIEWDIIYFKGTVSEYFKGKMLIVNIFNNSGRILRQFNIKERSMKSKLKSSHKSKTKVLNSKLDEKKMAIETRSLKTNPFKNLSLVPHLGNDYSEQTQHSIPSISCFTNNNKDLLDSSTYELNQSSTNEVNLQNKIPARKKFMGEKMDSEKKSLF